MIAMPKRMYPTVNIFEASLDKPLPPLANHGLTDAQILRNVLVLGTGGAAEHDLRAHDNRVTDDASFREPPKSFPLLNGQVQFSLWPSHRGHHLTSEGRYESGKEAAKLISRTFESPH